MSDVVMVRTLRTHLDGSAMRHPGEDPFTVSRPAAVELREAGFVEWVEPEEAPAAEPDPAPAPEAPKPRGRRAS